MGTVVNFKVEPKSLSKRYRNHDYVISYVVATKQWSWKVTYVEVTDYEGEPKATIRDAQRAAEKHIDRTLKLKGHGG